jgi:HAE1 family hydrophobic/amphiphilic exporter-1
MNSLSDFLGRLGKRKGKHQHEEERPAAIAAE